MKYFILFTLLLTGCTATYHKQVQQRVSYDTVMYISVHKLEKGDPTIKAYAEITGNQCKIYLRSYPQCLKHEIRHCFEGNWHQGRETDKDC